MIAISATAFGLMPVFARFAYASGTNPLTVLFFRFTLAGLLMLVIMAGKKLSFPRGKTLLGLILMGGLGYVGQSFSYFTALTYASASLVALLLYLYPALVTILAVLVLKERITKTQIVALGAALLGTALIIGFEISGQLAGILLGLSAAFIYSIYIIAGSVIIPKGTPYPLHRPAVRTFQTASEDKITVPVYEGEDPIATRNDLQGVIEYPLPEKLPVGTPVSVRFDYDRDRVLKVTIWVHGRDDLKVERTLTRDRPKSAYQAVDDSDDEWRDMLEGTLNAARHFMEQYSRYLEPGASAKMQSDIQRAERAFEEGNKAEGKRVTNALHRTIMGSGIATQLFLAERAMDGLGPQEASLIRDAVRELRSAYDAGNIQQVDKISAALTVAIAEIFRKRSGQTEVADQDFGGLLKDLG